jgi:hypothetical protein
MKIIFRTNLDNYSSSDFPNFITHQGAYNFEDLTISIPRIGETIEVKENMKPKFLSRKLPIRLNVCNVTYTESAVICELWYIDNDVKFAKLNNINLF